jgi:hypothetical protein
MGVYGKMLLRSTVWMDLIYLLLRCSSPPNVKIDLELEVKSLETKLKGEVRN